MNEELIELKNRITQLTDEELLEMVTIASAEYRQEALDLARAELIERGVDSSKIAFYKEARVEEASPPKPQLDSKGLVCTSCGGTVRAGVLVAEKELTIIFADNREERFVRVHACTQCGQLLLAADYETDVQR